MSDAQLVALIRQMPDSPALRVLFERYRPVLLRVQHRYFLPGLDADDWEQEAFLVLLAVVRQFEPQRSRSFGAFYRLNLQHRVFDLIRFTQAQKRQATFVSIEAHDQYFADTLADPSAHLKGHLEAQEAVIRLLPRLSTIERQVFAGLLQGHTLQHIGQTRQLRLAQVQGAMHRCRQKLRQLLHED